MFSQALADPQSFGLSNVTDPAAPGLEPGTRSYDTNQIASDANQYMFWDDLHPTTSVHAILAQRVLALFALPGDYNNSRSVDAADYVAWRKNDGTQDGYDAWRANFGATVDSGSLSNTTVPEPASRLLIAAASVAACVFCRSRRISKLKSA